MREVCFGIDVGGTTVKLGLVSREGDLLDKREFPTFRDVAATFDDIASHMRQVMDSFPDCICVGAGVGVPGPVVNQSLVTLCVNLGWENLNVAQELSSRAGVPVKAANDANLAALGEAWQGTGKGCRNLVLFTVGTGVGGGVLRDLLAQEMPYIFVKHIYACASLAGAAVCAGMWSHVDSVDAMSVGMATVVLIRALAAHYHWNLPKAKL